MKNKNENNFDGLVQTQKEFETSRLVLVEGAKIEIKLTPFKGLEVNQTEADDFTFYKAIFPISAREYLSLSYPTHLKMGDFYINKMGDFRQKDENGRLVRPTGMMIDKDGYFVFILKLKKEDSEKKTRSFRLARIVLATFTPRFDLNLTADHINQNRTDDRFENLRWATVEQQAENKGKFKEKYKKENIDRGLVGQIKADNDNILAFQSIFAFAKRDLKKMKVA